MTTSSSAASSPATLFGHPPGLTVLFLTQMWAEFSFFGLQALLIYYLIHQLAMPQATASLVYGIYGATAYFSPVVGGYVADRILGRTPAIILGGVLMMFGHFALAFEPLLYVGLTFVAVGNGLFLSPLAVQIAALYTESDSRRAQAFSIYYMGINLGGLLAPIVCGTLGEKYGWHWGFAVAGVGMLVGMAIYLFFRSHLPPDPALQSSTTHVRQPLTEQDRINLRILLAIGASVILFRVGYEQSGNIIALWVDQQTDRNIHLFGRALEIPATWFQSINPLIIILLTPVLVHFWRKRAESVGPPNLARRMAFGCVLASIASAVMVVAAWVHTSTGHPVSPWWVVAYFVALTLGELHVLPIGLALFGTLAPLTVASVIMGSWYIAKFLGSLVAGVMGTTWETIPHELFFMIGAGATLLAALALYWIGRVQSHAPEAVATHG